MNRFYSSKVSSISKDYLIPKSGTYPLGFLTNSTANGIKANSEKKDLSLVLSKTPCISAGCFTKNSFPAAPVVVSKSVIADNFKGVHAVIVNSGCANACTGDEGLRVAQKTCLKVENNFKLPPKSTVVMSTGVIGQLLDLSKVEKGVDAFADSLGNSHECWLESAKGIMTTDTFPKLKSKEYTQSSTGKTYRIAGWSKGAGMIHPNMATMLSSIFTDAKLASDNNKTVSTVLKYAVDRSFNSITVDGDTSTNDTVFLLANGQSTGTKEISIMNNQEYIEFRDNLTEFATDLAKLVVRDGEGATRFIEIKVHGAKSYNDAKTVATSIATSPLVKTAIYGKDANWGRIVCAVGYSGIKIDPTQVNLYFSGSTREKNRTPELHLFKNGSPFDVNEAKAAEILENEDIHIRVDLGVPKADGEAVVYTCDFSTEYIHINADYRS